MSERGKPVDLDLRPQARVGIQFDELDGEAVVYDRSGKQATYLNETATVIWKLCDGARSLREIGDALALEYPEATEVRAEVEETVDRLVKARLLVLVDAASQAP